MFAYIEGKLVHKEPAFVIIDVGGIGYEIRISLNTFAVLEDTEQENIFQNGKCRLQTYLQIKEDAHTLFGFKDIQEKRLFLNLISVSGIGSNTAMLMLSSLSTEEIQEAILTEDVRTIQSVKGIGGKTAQRVILELKDKLKKENLVDVPELGVAKTSPNAQSPKLIRADAGAALTALGFPKNTAEKNVEKILKSQKDKLKVEEIIKLALKI